MKIYVIIDKKTGKQLASHIENGPTLARWAEDLRSDGFTDLEIRTRAIRESKPTPPGDGND